MFAVNNITTYCPPVRPPNGIRTGVVPHPSQGGNANATEFRDQVISIWQNAGDLRSTMLEQLWQQRSQLTGIFTTSTPQLRLACGFLPLSLPTPLAVGTIAAVASLPPPSPPLPPSPAVAIAKLFKQTPHSAKSFVPFAGQRGLQKGCRILSS